MRNDVEPVVGAVKAYRWFSLEGGELWSVGAGGHLWTPGPNRARCHLAGQASGKTRTVWVNDPNDPDGIVKREEAAVGHGRIPAVRCKCGFWVLRDEPPLDKSPVPGFILGRVLIWGRAIEHELGYRVEYATIVALITEEPESLAPLLNAYGIPAVRPRTKAEQGLTTAFLLRADGDQVKLDVPVRDSDEVIGWFTVAPGVDVPDPVAHVTARFTPERVITEIRLHDGEEEW